MYQQNINQQQLQQFKQLQKQQEINQNKLQQTLVNVTQQSNHQTENITPFQNTTLNSDLKQNEIISNFLRMQQQSVITTQNQHNNTFQATNMTLSTSYANQIISNIMETQNISNLLTLTQQQQASSFVVPNATKILPSPTSKFNLTNLLKFPAMTGALLPTNKEEEELQVMAIMQSFHQYLNNFKTSTSSTNIEEPNSRIVDLASKKSPKAAEKVDEYDIIDITEETTTGIATTNTSSNINIVDELKKEEDNNKTSKENKTDNNE